METIRIDPNDKRDILDFRELGLRDALVLGRYRYRKASAPLESHSHGRLLEICYLHEGRQAYAVGEEVYELRGGDVFIARPGQTHGSGGSPEGRGTLYWLLLAPPKSGRRWLGLETAHAKRLWRELVEAPSPLFHAGGQLRETLERIFTTHADSDDPLRVEKLQARVFLCLCDLLDASRHATTALSPPIQRVIDLIERSGDAMLTVTRMAREAGLSTSRFKARFKDEVGMSPADYFMRTKVDRAKSMLSESSGSVTQIALELGFSSSQYFSTVFRRYTGVSPTEYRG